MGQCREGLHALPKTMFDLFLKAVGTFFEEGHEALPCTGYASPEYPCKRLIVNGAILSQQKSGEVGTLYSYNLFGSHSQNSCLYR